MNTAGVVSSYDENYLYTYHLRYTEAFFAFTFFIAT